MTRSIEGESRVSKRNAFGQTKEAVLSVFQTLQPDEKVSVRQVSTILNFPQSKVKGSVLRLKREGNILVKTHLVDPREARSIAMKGNTAKKGKPDTINTLIKKREVRSGPLSSEEKRKAELDVKSRKLPGILEMPSYEKLCEEKGRKALSNGGKETARRQLIDQVYAVLLSSLWNPKENQKVRYEDVERVNIDLHSQLGFERLMGSINGEIEFLKEELSLMKNFFPFDIPPKCRITNKFIRRVNGMPIWEGKRLIVRTAWVSYVTGEEAETVAKILGEPVEQVKAELEAYEIYINNRYEDIVEKIAYEESNIDPDLRQLDKEGSFFLRRIGKNNYY